MYLHNSKLKLHILLAVLTLLVFLTACKEESLLPTGANDNQISLPNEIILTTHSTAYALDPQADYTGIVINTVYSVGRMPNKALAEASFVELYNNTDRDIPLAGAALYLAGKTGNYTAYPFDESHVIPARGYFLIKGDPAIGSYKPVFTLHTCDATMPIRPDEYGFRMAIAPVGLTLDGNTPMGELEGLFTYVSSVPKDAEDFYHAAGNPQPDRIIRKKAATQQRAAAFL